MKVADIKKGDIITYQYGKKNYVNRPDKYHYYFDEEFKNRYSGLKINKIQRYEKFLFGYRLRTIYKRK